MNMCKTSQEGPISDREFEELVLRLHEIQVMPSRAHALAGIYVIKARRNLYAKCEHWWNDAWHRQSNSATSSSRAG